MNLASHVHQVRLERFGDSTFITYGDRTKQLTSFGSRLWFRNARIRRHVRKLVIRHDRYALGGAETEEAEANAVQAEAARIHELMWRAR